MAVVGGARGAVITAVALLLAVGVAVPGPSSFAEGKTADQAVAQLTLCVTNYQDDFDAFLSGGVVPNICAEAKDFALCTLNATANVEDESASVQYMLAFAQSVVLTVGEAASCERLQDYLWAIFFPEETEVTLPARRLYRPLETVDCVFVDPRNESAEINLALASGAYNRPDQGVAGKPASCDRQDRCSQLFRVNPCFDLSCGSANKSAACRYSVLREVSFVTASFNLNIGDPDTMEPRIRASDGALRLQYYATSRFDQLPITPTALAELFGLPAQSAIVTSIGNIQLLSRTRAYFVCDATANRLPRMEPVAQPREAGAFNTYDFEIRHRCACPGAANCTGPPLRGGFDLSCLQDTIGQSFAGYQLLFAVPFVFLERRVMTKPHLFWGMIGVPYPFNFLESRSQRVISALLFTVFATNLFSSFFSLAFASDTTSFAGTMQTLGETLVQSSAYYPIFLSATCRFEWFGALLGIFACLILIYDVIVVAACVKDTPLYFFRPIGVFQGLILAMVIAIFLLRLYKDVRARIEGRLMWTEATRKRGTSDSLKHLAFYEDHVRDILRHRTHEEEELELEEESKTTLQYIKSVIQSTWNSVTSTVKAAPGQVVKRFQESFRLSARLLAVGFMSVGWTILLTTLVSLVLPDAIDIVGAFLLNTGPDLRCRALSGYVLFPSNAALDATFSFALGCATNNTILVVVYWVLLGASLLTMLTQLIFIVTLFLGHRRRLRQLARGNKRLLPHSLPSSPVAVADMVKYLGYQIAHIYMGWIVLYALYFIILAIIAVCIVLPILEILPRSWLDFWLRQAQSLAFAYAFVLLQKLLVYLVFVIDRRSVAIRNRRWFHNFDFFAFLFNAIAGAFVFVQRWLLTAVLSVLFVSRLDITSLPQGYEGWDSSFRVYIGVVIVDAYYSNAVLITFVRMMIEGRANYSGDLRHHKPLHHSCSWRAPEATVDPGDADDLSYAMNTSEQDKLLPLVEQPVERQSYVARNRWFLALTLARNPGLRLLRRTEKVRARQRARGLAGKGDDVVATLQEPTFDPEEKRIGSGSEASDELEIRGSEGAGRRSSGGSSSSAQDEHAYDYGDASGESSTHGAAVTEAGENSDAPSPSLPTHTSTDA